MADPSRLAVSLEARAARHLAEPSALLDMAGSAVARVLEVAVAASEADHQRRVVALEQTLDPELALVVLEVVRSAHRISTATSDDMQRPRHVARFVRLVDGRPDPALAAG